MATDMQPFLHSLPSTENRSIPDRRDRHASVSPGSANHRFDHMLGTAQGRPTEPGHQPIAARPKQVSHLHRASHASTTSQTEGSSRTTESDRQERSVTHAERTQSETLDDFSEDQDEESIEALDESAQPAGLSPEMLLAAGLTTPAPAEGTAGDIPSPSADTAPATDATVEEPPSGKISGSASLESLSAAAPTASASAVDSGSPSGHTPSDGMRNAQAQSAAGPTKESGSPDANSDSPEAALPTDITNQVMPDETSATVTDGAAKEPPSEPDAANSATTVTVSHIIPKPAAGAEVANQSELESPFNAVMRTNDVSAGQNASSTGQFLSQDQQSSSEPRSGSDHAKSNLLPSDDKTLRPQFLDQATGLSPSAPPFSDSRVGRGETGQATMAHLSESERINEPRGAYPSAQTVTLDLDPLDMGPLRVRIMMSEQTVHAHIRTEHGELGQSLLQQGQSLEASLRTTGLEMGMLRVTVDQQQQGRGENAWAFQQQQGRQGLAAGGSTTVGEDEQVIRAAQDLYSNGRVSFFA